MDEDDEYMTEEADTDYSVPACELRPINLAILVLDAVADVARVPGRLFGDLSELVMLHANWQVQRRRFAREAAEEIERMVSEL